MNAIRPLASTALVLALAAGLGACGSLDSRERATATGAVIGGAAGAVLGGNTATTVGGAAVGAVIGNQVDKNRK